MPHRVWRIAADTPDYAADDLSGKGAEKTGGRWNRKGTPLVYTSSSMALACLETVVHLGGSDPLPLNRYLIEIEIPDDAWRARTKFDVALHVGWDALPAGLVSLDWGTTWAKSGVQFIAQVPSIVVPEECNVLLNPAHPLVTTLVAKKSGAGRTTFPTTLLPGRPHWAYAQNRDDKLKRACGASHYGIICIALSACARRVCRS